MSAPSDEPMFVATLYDGLSGSPQIVHVAALADGLQLEHPGGEREFVPRDELGRSEATGELLRLSRKKHDGWRLLIPVAHRDEFEALLGSEERYGGWIDRIGLGRALVLFAGLSAATVAAGYAAPRWIAPLVPAAWERNVGDAIVGDFGDNRCRRASGQRALEAMVERLSPGALEGPDGIRIAAIDVGIFNAAALPGGHIVVFKSAITETENPDALAGIVAHEIAHVKRRHVTQAMIRELGIGAFIRLFAGDIGANAQQIVALSYTRDNEAEADADAIAMLRRAGISPRPTAALFEQLADAEGEDFAGEFLSSHPASSARARNFARSHDPSRRYSPVLTQAQSESLFNICWDGPVAED